jgi:glycosyltransferase involved in cell wall biosynthesis
MEAEDLNIDPDIIIHYMPPAFMKPVEGKKNVSFFHYETEKPPIAYNEKIKSVDAVAVSTQSEMYGLLDLEPRMYKLPIPVSHLDYQDLKRTKESDEYIFYFIGEINTRKNLHGLLLAYLSEFKDSDNVKLVIKGNIARQDFHTYYMHVSSVCRKTTGLPKVEYIEGFISREQLLNFHKNCDCFISLSHGESICLPLIDALMVGNRAIVTKKTGMEDSFLQNRLCLVDSFSTPCFCPRPPIPFIYTSEESWRSPDISEAMGIMRAHYKNRPEQVDIQYSTIESTLQQFNRMINEVSNIV